MAEIVIGAVDGPVDRHSPPDGQTAGHSRCSRYAMQPDGAAADDDGAQGHDQGFENHRAARQRRAAATADAIVDCVADGTIARAIVDDICIIDLICSIRRRSGTPPGQEGPLPDQLRGDPARDLARAKERADRRRAVANRRKIKHVLFDPDA